MEDIKKFTADEVLNIIINKMENEERWKLLNELYHLHYDKRNLVKADIELDD
ncbi:hypothetical protein [Falsibacillus pallidus]|uniref:hypothetical protein n=1 Tax=Falsibacillus pallidus TaxID=493781 RepID=UPI003D989A6E